jgi:hypothetical protein
MVDIGGEGPPPVPREPRGDRGSSVGIGDLLWFLVPLVAAFVAVVAALYLW